MTRLVLGFLLLFAGCAADDAKLRTYAVNDFDLTTSNTAKLMCSCLFVSQMDEASCRALARAQPDVTKYVVDRERKVVQASAWVTWTARAHWVDARRGCVLE